MPRSSPAHLAEVRERILAGAERAFRAGGYRGASIPAIAAEAGVSVGLIYRYFRSKEELFLAVCEERTEAQMNELAALLGPMRDTRQRLETAIDFFVRSLAEQGWGAIVIQALAEADRNPRLRDMLIRLTEQERGFAAMFIREAIAGGEISPDVDIEALSLAVAMLLHGAVAHQAERGEAWDPDGVARAISVLLERALGG
ncbi:MAG TPA: TetR/AcrR family transcriptional regulator [candidate division Zixibacteria bacterium]|nr:TetR/AcrR family transcriptional regulator [candidate division Zixibacteria bacterium]